MSDPTTDARAAFDAATEDYRLKSMTALGVAKVIADAALDHVTVSPETLRRYRSALTDVDIASAFQHDAWELLQSAKRMGVAA